MFRFRPMTHMTSKGFAVGAALLAALVPCVARALPVIEIFGSDDSAGTVTFTSPTSFSSSGGLLGDACYRPFGEGITPYCGGYGFPRFSVTALSGTSTFLFNDLYLDTLSGTVEWTAVEGYPASPELIGTFTVDGSSAFPGLPGTVSLIGAAFLADFPVGAVYPISVSLGSALGVYCRAGPPCYGLFHGEILVPEILVPEILVPEPASLSVLGVALGLCLIARRAARRPPPIRRIGMGPRARGRDTPRSAISEVRFSCQVVSIRRWKQRHPAV